MDVDIWWIRSVQTLSMLCAGALIIGYFTSNKLRYHPSGIYVSLAICELVTTYHSMVCIHGSGNVTKSLSIDKMNIWKYLGINEELVLSVIFWVNLFLLVSGIVLGITYKIILCLDLTLSMRNPFSSFHQRMAFYHFISFLSLGISGYIFYDLINNLKVAPNKENLKIFIELQVENQIIHILLLIFLTLALISFIFSVFRFKTALTIKNDFIKGSLIRHILYMSINILLYAFIITIKYYKKGKLVNEDLLKVFIICFLSSGGVTLFLIRCFDKNFRQKIFSLSLFTAENIEDDANYEWDQSIINMNSELSAELTLNILNNLYLVYQSKNLEERNSVQDLENHLKNLRNSPLARLQSIDSISKHIKTTEYLPEIFSDIIRISNLTTDVIKDSINPLKNLENSIANAGTGKSGNLFVTTSDKKFLIKTLSYSEIETLKKILPKYAKHLSENKDSLICKIFGAFLMNFPGVTPIYIILIENISSNLEPTSIYDLKGSTSGRLTKKYPSSFIGPFKDLDFLRRRVCVPCADIESLQRNLINDSKFLKDCNLMDYSVLLCIEEKRSNDQEIISIYSYKIIDFLIEYKFFKKVERLYKVMLNPKMRSKISVMDSKQYSKRFISFMINRVFK